MFKEALFGAAGLGIVGGTGAAVIVPVVNSSTEEARSLPTHTQLATQTEDKDMKYLGKGVYFRTSVVKGGVTTTRYLQCAPKEGHYAYFRFQDKDREKKAELVCEYTTTKKDISKTTEEFEQNKISLGCREIEDYGTNKQFQCDVTAVKDIQLGGAINGSNIVFTWN
ncbi:hypothetical protein MHLP_01100 [Candidatus Mycoplasma haematolamae str. Purdue]|uniref:Uncharacterized protein n=1 Tax=Mycoplasma haematolamae (strain Purdue) TaxID=1212765 RepID=I7B953_MYCHA|nr:hypothetical protein [Candidatus Mycoplasma haematolamae]AFO51800.1 hypothetical protein MHLP_01100 [Candidatus Mycoplasma haematolamae str. Purdue]